MATRSYGEQLRYWLDVRRVSPATLAHMAGLSRTAVSNLLHGRTRAQRATHRAICRSLSIPEDRFFVDGSETIVYSSETTSDRG